tara:strand:+ start:44 stop:259 length:216 start_codon:yes stop_codon:yes gene_type:complete
MIEQNTGTCPFPDQKTIDKYIKNYSDMISKAADMDETIGLHTDDRYDLRAQFMRLINSGSVITNETWAEVV